jgi:hypothetical protein
MFRKAYVVNLRETGMPVAVFYSLRIEWIECNGCAMPQATDENGFWKSEHLADVPYRVSVHAAGFTPVEAAESNKITKVPLVITLEPAKPVLGIVVDADGKPVEKATVRMVSENRRNNNSYHGDSGNVLAESRADGTFELSELAPGTEYGLLIDAGDRGHAAVADVRIGTDAAPGRLAEEARPRGRRSRRSQSARAEGLHHDHMPKLRPTQMAISDSAICLPRR